MCSEEFNKVEGKDTGKNVKIFTISTCGWCKKTKDLLESMDIEYEYVDIDQVEGKKKKEIKNKLKEYNSKMSCPTVVIDEGEEVIIGFKKEDIKEALEYE